MYKRQALTSRAFFPQLIGPPFKHGLVIILTFAAVMSVIAALASALRGQKFIHEDDESRDQKALLTSGIAPSPNGGGAAVGAVPAAAATATVRPGRRVDVYKRQVSMSRWPAVWCSTV